MGGLVHTEDGEGRGPYPTPLHGYHHRAMPRAGLGFAAAEHLCTPGPQHTPHCGSIRCCPPLRSLNLELLTPEPAFSLAHREHFCPRLWLRII